MLNTQFQLLMAIHAPSYIIRRSFIVNWWRRRARSSRYVPPHHLHLEKVSTQMFMLLRAVATQILSMVNLSFLIVTF